MTSGEALTVTVARRPRLREGGLPPGASARRGVAAAVGAVNRDGGALGAPASPVECAR